ncbi:alcohol dehydrogenase [acceptor]-like [Amphiura filiformis]|uniref:alcohol dehydrogenase [acceptor]-like n=1 Tax=Amphiura filiformis TaxID=82378 RepID=UPI003B20B880
MAKEFPSYNYVVIGGGSAGCVVAARLSEDRTKTVLLLEAGPTDSDMRIDIPAAAPVLHGTRFDWAYKIEPQKNACLGFVNNSFPWVKGKVLGGSSSINYQGYVRGHAADFDSWESQGCTGWAWKDVLQHFIKSEKNQRPEYSESKFHGTDGPLSVTDQIVRTPFARAFVDAGIELGYNEIDINDGKSTGFGFMQATINQGKRCSTSKAFLTPAKKRKNLTVRTNALVTKIDIVDKKAVGVYFQHQGKEYRVKVEREVILSAGTVASPQILLLSGIGPKEQLKQHGIDCIADLPVGKNLQDHVFAMMSARCKPGSGLSTLKSVGSLLAKMKYIFLKKGPLSSNGLEATAFITEEGTKDTSVVPDIQIMYLPFLIPMDTTKEEMAGFKSEELQRCFLGLDSITEDVTDVEGVTLLPVLLHPKSRGEIRLRSTDPEDHPIIDPSFLDDPSDTDVLVKGLQQLRKLMETEAMRPFEFKLQNMQIPGVPNEEIENLAEYVRHFTTCVYHCVGTCKMGAKDDPTAVVDPDLRVNGIDGLRVIDASIMPTITSGNTNAPTIMIAEKGVHMIINQ